MSQVKQKVEVILKEIQKEDEEFNLTIFESGDSLLVPETTDNKGEAKEGFANVRKPKPGDKSGGDTDNPEPDDDPELEEEPDGDDGDPEPGGEEGDPEPGGGDDEPKIKVGQRVRIKENGKVGVVTQVNDDGTFEVAEEQQPSFSDGGQISTDLGGTLGTFTESEVEIIIENEGESGGEDGPDREPKNGGKKTPSGEPGGEEGDPEPGGEEGDPEPGGEEGDPEPGGEEGDPEPGGEEGDPNGPELVFPKSDIDDLRLRLMVMKNKKFKFPLLAKTFFYANLDNDEFYIKKAKLAYLNSGAKAVNRHKSSISAEDGKKFFNLNYNEHIAFLRRNVKEFGEGDSLHYKIDPDADIVVAALARGKTDFLPSIAPQIIALVEAGIETQTINGLEGVINSFEEGGRTPIRIIKNVIRVINDVLDGLEGINSYDEYIYRIVSLSMVLDPEMFGDNYLLPHINYMLRYLSTRSISVINFSGAVFQKSELTSDELFSKVLPLLSRNIDIITVIPDGNDYLVHATYDIINKPQNNSAARVHRYTLKEATSRMEMSIVLGYNISEFYNYFPTYKESPEIKNIVKKNMDYLSILQKESFSFFLTDINFQIAGIG